MTETLTPLQRTHSRQRRPVGPHYKWVALTNTTLGSFMVTIDASIVLIAFPAIFTRATLSQTRDMLKKGEDII